MTKGKKQRLCQQCIQACGCTFCSSVRLVDVVTWYLERTSNAARQS